jgi:hypothetical protein
LVWGIIFFGVCAILVILGLHTVAKADVIFAALFVVLVTVIATLAAPRIASVNFTTGDITQILFPFGVIIFALGGTAAITLLNNILKGQAHRLGRAIVWGSVIATVISLVFTLAVLGLGGAQTTPDSLGTVQQHLPPIASLAMAIFGLAAMGTTFLTYSLVLRDMYMFDYKLKRGLALFLTLIFPLAFFFLNMTSFVGAISFVGSVTGGLSGILYVLMYRRARVIGRRQPEFQISFPLWIQAVVLFVYVLAMAYEVARLF